MEAWHDGSEVLPPNLAAAAVVVEPTDATRVKWWWGPVVVEEVGRHSNVWMRLPPTNFVPVYVSRVLLVAKRPIAVVLVAAWQVVVAPPRVGYSSMSYHGTIETRPERLAVACWIEAGIATPTSLKWEDSVVGSPPGGASVS